MDDILLTRDGDLFVNDQGDIQLTTSVRQSVIIHLQWFFSEWKFSPQFGLPYFEEVFIKNPDLQRIRRIVRDEVEKVEAVVEARNITIDLDNYTRKAIITLEVVTTSDFFREEIEINV
jgi:hypothetical protein